ncbi:hypothetical protein V5H98_06255 [Georgenia sp. M64]|uniref:hypothetical protein n=1 Tax=Georgenia sp. M64 TaxID=3120520 RepID=UPI0030DFBB53
MTRVTGRVALRRGGAGVVLVLAALAGCADTADDVAPVNPTPVVVGESAPTAPVGASLPLPLAPFRMVEPGWDQVPEELDGTFLGLAEPTPDGDTSDADTADTADADTADADTADGAALRFVAADEQGTVLWEAARPPSCTGFALTRAGDRALAVLTDLAPTDDAVAGTTATAYDLTTGERVWGPVEVPGPHHGPGLVFSAGAPRATVGETGPRVVLDPATGEVLADESDEAGTGVVGEYDGTVLTAVDGELVATAGGTTTWRVPLASLGLDGAPTAVAGARPPHGTALLGAPGAETGALVDLADGAVLATDVADARRDPSSGAVVALGEERVTGLPATGEPWEVPVTGTRLAAAGGALVYLRVGDALQVLNATTGAEAQAYGEAGSAGLVVPVLFSAGGAAVVPTETGYGLVTTAPAGAEG